MDTERTGRDRVAAGVVVAAVVAIVTALAGFAAGYVVGRASVEPLSGARPPSVARAPATQASAGPAPQKERGTAHALRRAVQANKPRELRSEARIVTLAQYERLKRGMTYDEVVKIIGTRCRKGKPLGGDATYVWDNPDGSFVTLIFGDERLLVKLHGGVEAGRTAAPIKAKQTPREALEALRRAIQAKRRQFCYKRRIVTRAHYNQLKQGMTYDQVVKIIGTRGDEFMSMGVDVTYHWNNPDGSLVALNFVDNLLMTKMQFGL